MPFKILVQTATDIEVGMAGRKEMFYLTTHSKHFILRLYGVGHMVKDHSDSERGNPLPPHGLLFPINSTIPHRIAHTTAFVTPVMEHQSSDIDMDTHTMQLLIF